MAIRRRHAERMLEIARAAHLGTDDEEADVAQGLAEQDDLRGALEWAQDNDPELGLELAVELGTFWNASGPAEGMQLLGQFLDRVEAIPLELRARALRVYGGTAALAGHDSQGEELLEESRRLYVECGDEHGIAAV